MKDVFFIDGYNAINNGLEKNLSKGDFDDARDKFIDIVADYAAFCGIEAVVVFDAANVKGGRQHEEFISNIVVVFTAEGETADSYIEKAAYKLVRQGRIVYVVTSDWAEQIMILGAGAYRVSTREFFESIRKVKEQLRTEFDRSNSVNSRRELGNRINRDIAEVLDKWRRGG